MVQSEQEDPDLFFRDRPRREAPEGNVNREYVSLFSDEVSCLAGRTPLACYSDFMVRCSARPCSSVMTAV